jgi:hypothetical protein
MVPILNSLKMGSLMKTVNQFAKRCKQDAPVHISGDCNTNP